MITFVHLSDIHFRNRDRAGAALHETQFDLDQQLRAALLNDLESRPTGGQYDGLLVTGDIAYSGQPDEYKVAQQFLDELFQRCDLPPKLTYIVPGNHDVDRSYARPNLPLWDSHAKLRAADGPVVWHDIVDLQLHRDPAKLMLRPLDAYNNFSQGYGCPTTEKQLAWSRLFPTSLEDSTQVRLHGLNSALISDEGDAARNLLVTDFQTTHLRHSTDTIDVVLCHHPPDWLMDKAQLDEKLHAYARLCLFGHEHSTRILGENMLVQLYAGAVQPSRRDPDWLPTYHIVQLSVDTAHGRDLVVNVHTREFTTDGDRFRARRNRQDKPVDTHRIALPTWVQSAAQKELPSTVATQPAAAKVAGSMNVAETPPPNPPEDAERELLVYFFRLGSPVRYAVAVELDLLREGDDALDPRAMWSEVFQRAVAEHKLAAFWQAVASRTTTMRDRANPFKP